MIQDGTNLKVVDNTGAKILRCFKIIGGSKRRYARLGDIVVGSVKEIEPRRMIKKKDVVRAVIVRQRQPFRLPSGIYLRFDDNAAVILDGKTKNPKGNRVLGPIPRILKEEGFGKIVAMAKTIV
jgi:large subunit ribosomal protein L14